MQNSQVANEQQAIISILCRGQESGPITLQSVINGLEKDIVQSYIKSRKNDFKSDWIKKIKQCAQSQNMSLDESAPSWKRIDQITSALQASDSTFPESDTSITPDTSDTATESSNTSAETDKDTNYKINQWMYAKVLKQSCVAPQKPQLVNGNMKCALQRLAFDILSNYDAKNAISICTVKLALSSVSSTLNSSIASYFKEAVNDDTIWRTLSTPPLLPTIPIKCLITAIFTTICEPLDHDADKDTVSALICETRASVLRSKKNVIVLETLEILDYVVSNVDNWYDMDKGSASEADYILAIYPILTILFRRHKHLKSRTGEITSKVTKHARQEIKDLFGIDTGSATYGRKLDVMVTERETDVALCAIEWKKKEVEISKLLLQQCKNLRVNKCHLSHILKMELADSEKKSTFITGMDWRGFRGYMFGIEKVHDIYAANLIGELTIPLHLKLIKDFESTLLLLFDWREHLLKLAQTVRLAIIRQELKGSLDGVIGHGIKRERSATDLAFMTPKRRRSVVNSGDDLEE